MLVLMIASCLLPARGSAVKPKSAAPVVSSGAARAIPAAIQSMLQQPKLAQRAALRKQNSAAGSTTRTFSAYQRFLQPQIKKIAARALAANGHAQLPATAGVSGPGGISVNFPGFIQAPFFHAGTSTALTYASLSADVNKDGLPDLVTVATDGTVNVSLNPGNGGISKSAITSTNTSGVAQGAYPVYATSNDLNGDGYPDLEVLDWANNAVDIYMNRKDGTFADAVAYPIVLNSGALFSQGGGGMVFGDVNGDGKPDMVITAFTTTYNYPNVSSVVSVQVIPGNGDGTFGTPLPEQDYNFNGALSNATGQVQLADMNRDGKLDLVMLAGGFDSNFDSFSFVTVLQGDGAGGFGAFPNSFPTSGTVPSVDISVGSMYVGDVNGDGHPDVLFSVSDTNLYLALGNGDGTLNAPTAQLSSLRASLTGFADLDGDGNIDVISYGDGSISVNMGTGQGTFNSTALVQLVSTAGGNQQPAPADFNGDGKADIVQVDYASTNAGFFLANSGTFLGPTILTPAGEPSSNFLVLATGDLNGDGAQDLIAVDSTRHNDDYVSPLVAGINDGNGNFKYVTALSGDAIEAIGGGSLQVAMADLDGDGKADLLITTGSGFYLSLSNGDGTFSTPAPISLGSALACTPNLTDVGDLNGDGFPDIVLAYPGDAYCSGGFFNTVPSGFFSLLNDGKGNFTPSFTAFGYAAYMPRLVDLNGDKKLDLVLSDVDSNDEFFYLYTIPGNGDGTFNLAGAQLTLENTVVTTIIPGDFDGDGKQDLTVGVETQVDGNGMPVYNTSGVELMKGNGDFTFGLPVQYAPGLFPLDGKYADLNGDGRPDLALMMTTFDYYTNIPTSNFVYMANLGGGGFGPPTQTFTSALSTDASGSLFVSDFNGDGAPDVLIDPSSASGLFLNAGAVNLALSASSTTAIQGGTVTLTATITPVVSPQTPTGTITFYDNGVALETVPVSGQTVAVGISTLSVGKNLITATYSGDGNFNGATAASSVTVTVAALTPVNLALSASSLNPIQDSSVTLTATLSSTVTSPTPSGTVTFYDNGVALSTVPVSGNTATFTTATLSTGNHVITAAYSGDRNFSPATSSASITVAVSVLTPGFTLSSPTPASLTLQQGATGIVTLTMMGNATFSGQVSVTCTGIPAETTCAASPSTTTISATQSATVSVIIATTAPNNHYSAAVSRPAWMKATGTLSFAGLLFVLWPGRRKRLSKYLTLLVLICLGVGAAALTGCGSGNKITGTPIGNSTVTITATAGAVSQTTTIPVTITK
jgi:hypothetical protein